MESPESTDTEALMSSISLDLKYAEDFLAPGELDAAAMRAAEQFQVLMRKTGAGAQFTGWYDLPARAAAEVPLIEKVAAEIREEAEVIVVLGIGGSYLGARCALEALSHTFYRELPRGKRGGPAVYFGGQNISAAYLTHLLEMAEGKSLFVNVISKSGTTTETAIALRIFRSYLEKTYGEKEAARRIIATTDAKRGGLLALAKEKGYRTFVIPDDVGGRFSVLTPVGLLPIACGGIDISEMLDGARSLAGEVEAAGAQHPAIRYAAVRNLLHGKGRAIEILATFEPRLHLLGEWWKQLFGESEGKQGKGLFPASVDFSTDLHSLGQWIQEGPRIFFETFLLIEHGDAALTVPGDPQNSDGLGYLEGRALEYVNSMAAQGTMEAHHSGGAPVLRLILERLDESRLGSLFQFFEIAVAVSGYMLGVNPFDQPGVEAYKKNMFRLLGKPNS
jgi:glucose-6-phosphate isomerase